MDDVERRGVRGVRLRANGSIDVADQTASATVRHLVDPIVPRRTR
jgi:hypothetical protein